MPESAESHMGLVIFNSFGTRTIDINFLFGAVSFVNLPCVNDRSGPIVAVDSLWAPPGRIAGLTFADAVAPREPGVMDDAKALDLARVELDRYNNLPDEALTAREVTTREAIKRPGLERPPGFDVNLLACTFQKMGGIAVLKGTLDGVRNAAENYARSRPSR